MIPAKITIHCSDSPNGKYIPFEEIKRWHTDPPPKGRGFKDIGYHIVINTNGEVHQGRLFNEEGAHVAGHNSDNLGICLVGAGKYTPAQWQALRNQIQGIMMTFHKIDRWSIYMHNQYDTAIKQGKTCPIMEVNRVLYWYHLQDETAIKPYILDTPT